ncbi:ComEA family DNA-binding protein [bacterium]|nr:ComEA family DNA-binding protein [candidate division CSSED10-310 bacterium]
MKKLLSSIAYLLVVAAACQALDSTPVNINTATNMELQTLPGIGPGLAQLIIDYRNTNGPFQSLDELGNVPKIGDKTLERLKDLISLSDPDPVVDVISKQDVPEESQPTATPLPSVDEILASFDLEPSIRDVQIAAIRFAEIDGERFAQWRQKAKEKGLWPDSVQFTLGHDTDDDRDYTRTNTISISGGTTTVGPDKETWKRGTDDDFDYQLRFRWKLQDYCFSNDILRVSSETEKQVKFRQSVIEDVTELYYDRRALQVEMILQPEVSITVKVKRELQIQELTAAIDGLTGGFFSEALARSRETAAMAAVE